jgi:hypothetical protein
MEDFSTGALTVRRDDPNGYRWEQFDVMGAALATGMKQAAKAFVSHR